ncbi:hypothetical protein M758_8G188400 [Ceratodon purpureus]|nr:hypothetical protein M758_8G188400 [Ceratodon purpureus]
MEEQQEIEWIGGVSAGQDVTIRLVRMGLATEETLAAVKLHSNVLSTYSKYFNTCLSERWRNLEGSPESSKLNFVLETQADVEFYFDCFARMHSPHKRVVFDVKYGLELLKVASQIEFHELIESTSLYLSSTFWSEEDAIRIKEYSSSPDFPHKHATELVDRLGLDTFDKSGDQILQNLIEDFINQIVRTALHSDVTSSHQVYDRQELSARHFVEQLLQGLGPTTPYEFARMVVNLVTNQAKDMVVSFGKECEDILSVEQQCYRGNFENKLVAICWMLKASLPEAKLGKELVSCFAHLDAIPNALGQPFLNYNRMRVGFRIA